MPPCPCATRPTRTRSWTTEALFGERVTVYEESEGWAWVQLAGDGYVGYLPGLGAVRPPAARRRTG